MNARTVNHLLAVPAVAGLLLALSGAGVVGLLGGLLLGVVAGVYLMYPELLQD